MPWVSTHRRWYVEAAIGGGNCELTKLNETYVTDNGVTIIGFWGPKCLAWRWDGESKSFFLDLWKVVKSIRECRKIFEKGRGINRNLTRGPGCLRWWMIWWDWVGASPPKSSNSHPGSLHFSARGSRTNLDLPLLERVPTQQTKSPENERISPETWWLVSDDFIPFESMLPFQNKNPWKNYDSENYTFIVLFAFVLKRWFTDSDHCGDLHHFSGTRIRRFRRKAHPHLMGHLSMGRRPGFANLPARMAEQASAMYAQNMANLLRHVHGKGSLNSIWKGKFEAHLQKDEAQVLKRMFDQFQVHVWSCHSIDWD